MALSLKSSRKVTAGDVIPFENPKKKKQSEENLRQFMDELERAQRTPADLSQDPMTYENAIQEAQEWAAQPGRNQGDVLYLATRLAARKVAWAMLNTARSYNLPKEIIEHLRQVAATYAPD